MILLMNRPLMYFLKITGLWPYGFHFIGPLIIFSSILCLLPFQYVRIVSLSNDFLLMMDSLSDVLTEILIIIKFIILWINKSLVKDLIKEIFKEWKSEDISDQWKVIAYYSRTFCTINICSYLGTIFFYYLDVILTYITKPENERRLVLDVIYPFDYHSSPTYEIIFLVQTIQAFALAISDSLTQILLVTLVLHISAHIESLKNKIQKYADSCVITLNNKNNNYGSKIYLRSMVVQHTKLLDLVGKVDAIYSYVSLSQLLFSNAIICVTEFVIISAAESARTMLMLKFITFIVAMLTQAFTYCYVGQYLLDKGESIIYPIYDCCWFNTSYKKTKTLIFMIKKAQLPLELNGGKLFRLSLNSFLLILKTSFSYFSVLRAMYS